ncbi:esterase FE4-like isoform X2 [Temnothorax longispinosus]|uniref:esterase FE4-like isoform X2 n=1 Tax=Temnothorax longispinosus TaxID=300112 RepID=UPI003A99EC7A
MGNKKVDVHIHEGRLIGTVEEDGYGGRYFAFRGIPYAKPPIGELRFKDPVPPEPWSGDRDAFKYGNVAVQLDIFSREIIGDEDCLYLNVYTTDLNPAEKRAVMVWIHGGGFFTGSGNAIIYGPDYIVQKDVVLVTLNYRLGVLGFLNLDDKVATGNQGLKDVVMALQWVQKNISKFSGNPTNITIFGESAGGAIVHYITLSPLAKGLFHKAISQSGVITNPWAFDDWTNNETMLGFKLVEKLGKATSDPKVAYEFLKTIDAKKLIETEQKSLLSEIEYHQIVLTFKPSLDSKSPNPFLPEHPRTLIHRGVTVPFLLGFTSQEGIFFVRSKFFGHISNKVLKQIDSDFEKAGQAKVWSGLSQIPITPEDLRFLYFGDKPVSEETLMDYSNFLGDELFYRGTMEIADIQTKLNSVTYLYQFSYKSETSVIRKLLDINLSGSTHFEDVGYLFCPHMMKDLGISLPTPDSKDYKMINYITQLWADFAKTGNPTPVISDLCPIKWIPLKSANVYHYLDIDIELQMKVFRKGEQRWNWENIKKNI